MKYHHNRMFASAPSGDRAPTEQETLRLPIAVEAAAEVGRSPVPAPEQLAAFTPDLPAEKPQEMACVGSATKRVENRARMREAYPVVCDP